MKLFIVMVFFLAAASGTANNQGPSLAGAWESRNGNEVSTAIFSEKYFSVATYSVTDKSFGSTRGGSWAAQGETLVLTEEFNTAVPGDIGKPVNVPYTVKGDRLTMGTGSSRTEWKRVDKGGPGKLAGAWLITGRVTGDGMQKITPGARRTMKILSGTRFQWIAYNTETREFFGTGGGTYTTNNGKYAETIEFFSRDNTRVGKTLSFDFALQDGDWRHTGLSSKGDPIDEVWTRREKLGL